MSLTKVVYRIATDESFAAYLQREPEVALSTVGLTLDKEEMAAMLTILKACEGGLCSLLQFTPGDQQWWSPQFTPRLISTNASLPE